VAADALPPLLPSSLTFKWAAAAARRARWLVAAENLLWGARAQRRGFCAPDRIVRTGKVVVQVKKRIVVRAPLAAVGGRPFPDLKMATGLWSL
jgi:hypothetical protein